MARPFALRVLLTLFGLAVITGQVLVDHAAGAENSAKRPGNAAAVKQLLTAAIMNAQQLTGPGEKAEAYGAIAAIESKAGETANAKVHLKEALTAAAAFHEPDARERAQFWTRIAENATKVGDLAAARECLSQAQSAVSQVHDDLHKESVLERITEALLAAKDREGSRRAAKEAVATAGRSKDGFPAYFTARDIAKSQARAGDIEGAKATAALIAEHRPEVDAAIAVVQARNGDPAGAETTLGSLADDRALYAIANAQAKADKMANALATISRIKDDQTKADAYLCLADAWKSRGDKRRARQFLHEAKAAVPRFKQEELNDQFYMEPGEVSERSNVRIATLQAEIGDFAEAEATASQLRLGRSRAEAFVNIAEARFKAQDTPAARVALKAAHKGADETADPEDQSWVYTLVASAQNKIGDRLDAIASVKKATEAASQVPWGEEQKARTYARIGKAQAERNDTQGVRETLASLRTCITRFDDPDSKWIMYCAMAALQAKTGAVGDAVKTIADNCPDPAKRCECYAIAANELLASTDEPSLLDFAPISVD